MDDLMNIPLMNPTSSSPLLTYLCANEMLIRNHPYIISMYLNDSEQPQIDVKVESRETADQWESTFDVNAIEKITSKTGNFKSFSVFINMLENAINQKSPSLSIDFLTSDDLELIRQNKQTHREHSNDRISRKRYLILIYNVEYDCIYYPLSLKYSGKPDPVILIEQIRQLAKENHLLKSQFQSDNQRLAFQQECFRLKKENEEYRQQLLLFNSKEKDQQIEFLRQMIRATEENLNKERNNLNKTKTKKDEKYKLLINQIESLKISERQLKLQVKYLTNEINLINKNGSAQKSNECSSSLSRTVAKTQRRYRSASATKHFSTSTNSHGRFDPTAYIQERNSKLQEIELQKKKDTQRQLSVAHYLSDSDISNPSLKLNEHHHHHQLTQKTKENRNRKRTHKLHSNRSNGSIDSDIEGISSSPILYRATSNNSTLLQSPEHPNKNQQNSNLNKTDDTNDIDQRLKSLEKFIKQNLPH